MNLAVPPMTPRTRRVAPARPRWRGRSPRVVALDRTGPCPRPPCPSGPGRDSGAAPGSGPARSEGALPCLATCRSRRRPRPRRAGSRPRARSAARPSGDADGAGSNEARRVTRRTSDTPWTEGRRHPTDACFLRIGASGIALESPSRGRQPEGVSGSHRLSAGSSAGGSIGPSAGSSSGGSTGAVSASKKRRIASASRGERPGTAFSSAAEAARTARSEPRVLSRARRLPGPMPGQLFEDRRHVDLRAQLPLEFDREAMRLVPDALEQQHAAAARREQDRSSLRPDGRCARP